MHFYVGKQVYYKKGLPTDSNVIRENAKSLHGNIKQNEGEGSKAGGSNASKGWSIILEMGLALRKSR